MAAFASLIKLLFNNGHLLGYFLLNQKYYVGWFLLKRFVDLGRVSYLHIVDRNQSRTLLLINLQKKKPGPKKAPQQKLFAF